MDPDKLRTPAHRGVRRPFIGVPASPGDRIEINGTKPPCPQCKGAMNRAVNELGVSMNDNWGGATWSAIG